MSSHTLLQGKKIIVTGAARGLGLGFAQAIAQAGAQVVMADILDELVHQEAADLNQQGLTVYSTALDLSQPESVHQCAEFAIQKMGGLDGLVNCAALATGVGGQDLMEYDPVLWDRVMTINVKGTWLMVQACVPYLKQSGSAKIVNIASDTALWGAPRLMAYVASKGAILSMTRSMARELGEFEICVNTISPGLTLVEATEYVP